MRPRLGLEAGSALKEQLRDLSSGQTADGVRPPVPLPGACLPAYYSASGPPECKARQCELNHLPAVLLTYVTCTQKHRAEHGINDHIYLP